MTHYALTFIKKYGKTIALVVAVATIAVVATLLVTGSTMVRVKAGPDNSDILKTPAIVDAIEQIGEWEFLSIETEEMVDTTSKKTILGVPVGSKELIRIYPGTLRLGIDMSVGAENMVRMDGDTVRVALPPVTLLSDDFIDETLSTTFYEDGSWSAADSKRLYKKARRQMKQRHLTAANMQKAREKGIEQMENLLKSLGVRYYTVE